MGHDLSDWAFECRDSALQVVEREMLGKCDAGELAGCPQMSGFWTNVISQRAKKRGLRMPHLSERNGGG